MFFCHSVSGEWPGCSYIQHRWFRNGLSIVFSFSSQGSEENMSRHASNNLFLPLMSRQTCPHWKQTENRADTKMRNQVRNVFLTDLIKIHGGRRCKSFRKHRNQALIAFQASALGAIELDYLCADLLQSSSTTWGLHINPSVLMARKKEPRLGAPPLLMCADKNMV